MMKPAMIGALLAGVMVAGTPDAAQSVGVPA
jgi:hypothetical protein